MTSSEWLPDELAQLARERPDDVAILFVDGPEWTWAEVQRRVRDHAEALQRLGVAQGDTVLSWMPNGPIAVLNLLALASLGAVYVPINIGYRGALLEHVLRNSGARLMIAHGELVARLAGLQLAAVHSVVVVGPERPPLAGVHLLDERTLAGDGARLVPPLRAVAPWDTLMIIYTSGTTGPSKGVLSSYRHARAAALGFRNVGAGDRNLTLLPMFHVGGVLGVLWALFHRGSVVVAESFRTAEFWPVVRRYRVTTTGLLGSMVDMLNAQPVRAGEREHGLRNVLIAPYGAAAMAFTERFAVDAYTEFNMSELSVPLFAGPNPGVAGTCGTPAAGVELRIVDAHDIAVPEGAVGELVLRVDDPWTISHGYNDDPIATARAWRNGWFHTGDLFRCDSAGHYHFVDRASDSIRRRGENISAFEVEAALRLHPAIVEAVAVGVEATGGNEQEVLAVVRVADGAQRDPAEILEFLRPRLPHFMLPRYVRFVDDLPKTPTQKIEKYKLRAAGVTADTWDREQAGVAVRRERLERRG